MGYVNVGHTLLILVLILLIIAMLPRWPYSAGWSYYPSGGIAFFVLLLLVLMLFGAI